MTINAKPGLRPARLFASVAAVILISCLGDDDSSQRTVAPVEPSIAPLSEASPQSEESTPESKARLYPGSVLSADAPNPFHVLFPDDLQGGAIGGFRQTANASGFALGAATPTRDDSVASVHKSVGPFGVFVEYDNGYSAGIPNAVETRLSVGPYSMDHRLHTEHVKAYFLERGLPADQVGGTAINTWMREGGPTYERLPSGEYQTKFVVEVRELLAYLSVIQRSVGGAEVADSFAWAIFNKKDEVVYEQVWWPELRASLVEEVAAFRARLGSGEYQRSLPIDGEGKLRIHHANPTGVRWYSVVTYDVQRPDDPETHSFDVSGNAVTPWSLPLTGTK